MDLNACPKRPDRACRVFAGPGGAPVTVAAGIFLFVLGAILRFATDIEIAAVSVDVIGLILMIGGGLAVILGLLQLAILSRGGRREALVVEEPDPTAGPNRDPH